MVDLRPANIFIPNAVFWDMVYKSGRFLLESEDKLMASGYMKKAFSFTVYRLCYILQIS